MKITIIIILSLIIVLTLLYGWMGGFRKIIFQKVATGGETLVYEHVVGDYRNSAKVMDKIYEKLRLDENIETFKGFGIYYDNPQKVETEKLRCDAGCILPEQLTGKAGELAGKFNLKTLPVEEYLVAEFPYKGKMSVIMGLMRVYPALNRYIAANGLNESGFVMEIYDVPGKKIIYRKKL